MNIDRVKKGMEIIGADGVHVGTVEQVKQGRIRLAKQDSGLGRHQGHSHYIDLTLVSGIDGNTVRLLPNATIAVSFEEEASGKPV